MALENLTEQLAAQAKEIATRVTTGPYIANHGGIHPSTRKVARAAALEAARVALGLPARKPFVWPED